MVEYLRVNDALRRRIGLRDLEGLTPTASLPEAAKGLVNAGLTNEEEIGRVMGK
jgi:hypothetical protein